MRVVRRGDQKVLNRVDKSLECGTPLRVRSPYLQRAITSANSRLGLRPSGCVDVTHNAQGGLAMTAEACRRERKAHWLVGFLAITLLVLVGGGTAPSARADACRHADVVFYTTDTQNLATRLAANRSDCADYYISISPIVTPGPSFGEPRDGAALTTVHAQGPRFHALAELRPTQWLAYAAANGWYATGVRLHDDMLL